MELLGWDSQGLCWLLKSGKLWERREAVEGERNIGKWKIIGKNRSS